MVRANLNKDPDDVSKMFDAVANRYDFLNDLLSLGRTKAWRRVVTSIIAPKPGIKILDIAAGTGSSSRPLVDKGADVIALDFSEGMLAQGRKQNRDIKFMQGDALNLPFEENTFDVTTISFGLRNTSNTLTALKEALRVTKVGGKIVVAEFSHPTNLIFRKVYLNYLMKALPVIARKVSKNPDAYVIQGHLKGYRPDMHPAQEDLDLTNGQVPLADTRRLRAPRLMRMDLPTVRLV